MRRPGRFILSALLAALVLGATLAALWLGLVPQCYSPLAPISLDEPTRWFTDFRLAALRRDPALCKAILREPHIAATPVPDNPITDGCGWVNAFQLRAAGGAEIGIDKLTCEEAAALALWVEHAVQPLALSSLGSRVTTLEDMGAYSCRNMIGNSNGWACAASTLLPTPSTFPASSSRTAASSWWQRTTRGTARKFLHAAHMAACKYFRVAIGPNFNAAHWNHIHLDRGVFIGCK